MRWDGVTVVVLLYLGSLGNYSKFLGGCHYLYMVMLWMPQPFNSASSHNMEGEDEGVMVMFLVETNL